MVDFEMETFEERVAGQELDNFVDIRHVLLDVFFNQLFFSRGNNFLSVSVRHVCFAVRIGLLT